MLGRICRLGIALATALGVSAALADEAPESIRLGYAISLTGPYAPGAESTGWSQYKLWQKDVNDAGGIYLKKYDKKVPVELVEYDDRSQIDEMLKLVERLIIEDKVDFVLAPWGSAMNMAVAPLLSKYKYPTIHLTASGEKIRGAAPRWPYSFWALTQPDYTAESMAGMLARFKEEGKIDGRIAIMSVADQLGIELNSAMVKAAEKHGIEVVYNKSYPLGVSDLSTQIREMAALEPDAFFGFSYPTDTFMLTEQSIVLGFSPKMFYTAVGTPFAPFKGKFGDKVEGIMGFGGLDIAAPGLAEYWQRHIDMWDRPSESGAVGAYATMEILKNAIEAVGEVDRDKVREYIAGNAHDTIWGQIKFEAQMNSDPWTTGQWQNGEFVGILPADKPNAQPVLFPKPKF